MSDDSHPTTPEPAQPDGEPAGATPPEQPAGAYLPSGARVEEESADADAPKGVSRRNLLAGLGIGAAVVAAGGLGSGAFISNQPQKTANGLVVTKSWADKTIAVTSPSGVCDAPLVAAYENGFFKKAGLDVVLKKTGSDEDLITAVGSGKYTASNGIFFNYLGPIYNGTPVKLSGGLHHGCLDLYVRNDGSISSVADLNGEEHRGEQAAGVRPELLLPRSPGRRDQLRSGRQAGAMGGHRPGAARGRSEG